MKQDYKKYLLAAQFNQSRLNWKLYAAVKACRNDDFEVANLIIMSFVIKKFAEEQLHVTKLGELRTSLALCAFPLFAPGNNLLMLKHITANSSNADSVSSLSSYVNTKLLYCGFLLGNNFLIRDFKNIILT